MSLWTDDEVGDLGLSWGEFSARHPSRSYKAWWNKRAAGSPSGAVGSVPAAAADLDAYFERLLEAADLRREGLQGERQVEVSVRLSDEGDLRPVGVAFTGDWHCGQRGTNHRLLRQANDVLGATEGLYVIGMGDYTNNAKSGTRAGNALYESIFPDPDDQARFARRELEKLKGKLIGLARGCHEDWDRQLAGRDPLQALCDALGTRNLWHGGVVHVAVGQETYHLGVRHKFYGESKLNSTNAQRTFYDQYPQAEHLDVVALGHLHYCDLQKRSRRGRQTVYLRSGSYHETEEYGQKLGGFRAEAGVPLVILHPTRHSVIPFAGPDLVAGLSYLDILRARLAPLSGPAGRASEQ